VKRPGAGSLTQPRTELAGRSPSSVLTASQLERDLADREPAGRQDDCGAGRAAVRPGRLVGYLGLDPKVRQSGNEPAHHGRISKARPSAVRHTLTEADLLTIRAPGPMRALHERVRARGGHQIATVAVARKLAVLVWHLLTRGEDYAYGSPTLTQKKIRQMELTAGAPSRKGHRNPGPTGLSAPERRNHERQFAEHAELAYKRLVIDWQRTGKRTATT
jgi:transposase